MKQRNLLRVLLLYVMISFFSAGSSLAVQQEGQRLVLLDRVIGGGADPAAVYVLYRFGKGSWHKALAECVTLAQRSRTESVCRCGVVVAQPQQLSQVEYSMLVEERDGSRRYLPRQKQEISHKGHVLAPLDQLRETLLEAKSVARRLEMEHQSQQDAIERLQADADIIGYRGRLTIMREKIEAARTAQTDLTDNIERLQQFLRGAGQQESPANFLKREEMLTVQLNELAQAARAAEDGEPERRLSQASQADQDTAALKAARYLDPDQLRKELVELRRYRQDLEQRMQGEILP